MSSLRITIVGNVLSSHHLPARASILWPSEPSATFWLFPENISSTKFLSIDISQWDNFIYNPITTEKIFLVLSSYIATLYLDNFIPPPIQRPTPTGLLPIIFKLLFTPTYLGTYQLIPQQYAASASDQTIAIHLLISSLNEPLVAGLLLPTTNTSTIRGQCQWSDYSLFAC